jgi:hypothetical protein
MEGEFLRLRQFIALNPQLTSLLNKEKDHQQMIQSLFRLPHHDLRMSPGNQAGKAQADLATVDNNQEIQKAPAEVTNAGKSVAQPGETRDESTPGNGVHVEKLESVTSRAVNAQAGTSQQTLTLPQSDNRAPFGQAPTEELAEASVSTANIMEFIA